MARRPRLAFAWELAPLDTTTTYVVLEDRSRMLYEGITVERFYSPPEERRLSQAGYEKIYATNGWHVWRRR